jgi:hypothetical protein
MPKPMDDPLAPLSWGRAFTTWRFAPITTAVLLVALLLRLAAVVAVRRRGERRPVTAIVTSPLTGLVGYVAVLFATRRSPPTPGCTRRVDPGRSPTSATAARSYGSAATG